VRRALLLAGALAAAAPAAAKIVLLDNFDAGEFKNMLQGQTGAWDLDPDNKSVNCVATFNDRVHMGETGKSLKLDYTLENSRRNVYVPSNNNPFNPAQMAGDSAVYNGYYSIFGPMDLRECHYVTMWIKGDKEKGFTRTVKLELKDANGASGVLIEGITDQWQRFQIPFERFEEIQDWSVMKEFVFVFGVDIVTKKTGAIYVDDVYFCSTPYEKLRSPRRDVAALPAGGKMTVDALLSEWPAASFTDVSDLRDYMETGEVSKLKKVGWKDAEGKRRDLPPAPKTAAGLKPADLGAQFAVSWDDRYLYIAADVRDNEIVNDQSGQDIWKDDCLEIYLDPQGRGFNWGDPASFQIGFAPTSAAGRPAVWSWFQKRAPTSDEMKASLRPYEDGYQAEIALSWTFLGVTPAAGKQMGFSLAVHDRDTADKTAEAKLNWSYEALKSPAVRLGTLTLQER
jgi:hypothetical protein